MPFTPGRFGPFGGIYSALPPFPGKWRLIDWTARLYCRFGPHDRENFPWPGNGFSVDLHDRIQRLMWCGSYEPHITRCLKLILRSGDTFLDVGANIGYHSFFAAKLVEDPGRVFSFEPDPVLYPRLVHNLSSFPSARAVNAAVCDRDAIGTFERSFHPTESGWGTLAQVRSLGQGQQISVQTLTLDSFLQTNGILSVRAIKLDAEGSEFFALQGAARLLRDLRPALLFEVSPPLLALAGSTPDEIGSLLRDHNFKLFEISSKGLNPREFPDSSAFSECLAVPAERIGDFLLVQPRSQEG